MLHVVLNQLMLPFTKFLKKSEDIFDNDSSEKSSDSDERGSYSSADEHCEIEPL